MRKAKRVFVFMGKSDSTRLGRPVFIAHAVGSRRLPRLLRACLPSPAAKPPPGRGWLHEIKHDGFRMLVRRDAAGVRLFTRNGHDWTGCVPLIARAALSLRAVSCLIDGEAVACDDDGLPVFDRLRYQRDDRRVFLYALGRPRSCCSNGDAPPRVRIIPRLSGRPPGASPVPTRSRRRLS